MDPGPTHCPSIGASSGASPAAAAALDPETGRIVGFAAPGRSAARVELAAGGRVVRTCLAAAPMSVVGPAARARLGEPPSETCGFELRLPETLEAPEVEVRCEGRPVLNVAWRNKREMRRYREGSVMADSVTLEGLRLHAGVLRARLVDEAGAAAPPVVEICLRGVAVGAADLKPEEAGVYGLTARLPVEALGDGVAVLEFRLADGSILARYPLAAGAALAGDIAAEVASLRAELDQLKRAVRSALAGGVVRRDERPVIVAEALVQVEHLLEMRDRTDRRQEAFAADELLGEDDQSWDVEQ